MYKVLKKIVFILLVLLAEVSFAQRTVTVSNLRPAKDLDANIVDAHDGCMVQSDAVFYWFGVNATGSMVCFSSTDWGKWRNEVLIVKGLPDGVVSNPRVLFHAKSKSFVLWFKWKDAEGLSRYGVAKANRPSGPFTVSNTNVNVFNRADGLGDFSVFTDVDGTSYLAYTTLRDLGVSVERLSPDFISSTLQNGGYLCSGYQVSAQFERNGKYYLLMDRTTDFDVRGTGARLYVSNRPMDSYVFRSNINRYPGTPSPVLVDRMMEPNLYAAVRKMADGTFAPVQIERRDSARTDCLKLVLFTGNRTQLGVDSTSKPIYEPIRTPSFEIQQWKNGGWVNVLATQTAMTSSVYTVVSLRFAAIVNKHFRVRVSNNFPSTLRINELELSLANNPLAGACKAYVCDMEEEQCLPRIPGQTACVFPLKTASGTRWVWMADLWGSASDNLTAHDYTYFGSPLEFNAFGDVEPFAWSDSWQIVLP